MTTLKYIIIFISISVIFFLLATFLRDWIDYVIKNYNILTISKWLIAGTAAAFVIAVKKSWLSDDK